MRLFRFISKAEFTKLINGIEIKGRHDHSETANTTIKGNKIFFFPRIDKPTEWYEEFLFGMVDLSFIVEVDIPEERLTEGYGLYADYDAPNQHLWPTQKVKEYGIDSYTLEDTIVIYKNKKD